MVVSVGVATMGRQYMDSPKHRASKASTGFVAFLIEEYILPLNSSSKRLRMCEETGYLTALRENYECVEIKKKTEV